MRLQPLGHLSGAPRSNFLDSTSAAHCLRASRRLQNRDHNLKNCTPLPLLALLGFVELLGKVVFVGHLFDRVQLTFQPVDVMFFIL